MKHVARGAFLVAAVVLTLGGYRDALANGCKPDGGTCRTNQSCCSRLCAKAPTAKFGVCCTPDCTGKACGDDGCGGSCGECTCSGAGDCPIGMACNTTTGQCESACGDASHSICHGGCCGGGTCQPGTVPSACGSGRACVVCDATNPSGSACVIGPTEGFGGHCGCNASETDCPAASEQSGGEACLLAGIDLCTTECLGPNETGCNGGCCTAAFGTTGGTCQPGTADTACGVNTGGPCVDCTASLNHCVNGTCMP